MPRDAKSPESGSTRSDKTSIKDGPFLALDCPGTGHALAAGHLRDAFQQVQVGARAPVPEALQVTSGGARAAHWQDLVDYIHLNPVRAGLSAICGKYAREREGACEWARRLNKLTIDH